MLFVEFTGCKTRTGWSVYREKYSIDRKKECGKKATIFKVHGTERRFLCRRKF
jgi:hypothetical protein